MRQIDQPLARRDYLVALGWLFGSFFGYPREEFWYVARRGHYALVMRFTGDLERGTSTVA